MLVVFALGSCVYPLAMPRRPSTATTTGVSPRCCSRPLNVRDARKSAVLSRDREGGGDLHGGGGGNECELDAITNWQHYTLLLFTCRAVNDHGMVHVTHLDVAR